MLIDNETTFNNLFSKIDIHDDISENVNDREKNRCYNLRMYGESKPCILCNLNTGYINYTICCQIPIHLICYDEQKETKKDINLDCPNCSE